MNRIAFTLAAFALASCGEVSSITAPDAAPIDRGGTYGSGGNVIPAGLPSLNLDGGWTAGSGNRTAGGDSAGITSDRGIGMIGGGRSDEAAVTSPGVLIGSTGLTPPSTPHMDGGVTLGSGSRRTTGRTDNTTAAADSGSTAARGGVTHGSGS